MSYFDQLNGVDLRLTRAIQSLPSAASQSLVAITNTGSEWVTTGVAVVALVIASVRQQTQWAKAFALTIAAMGGYSLLKLLFQRLRPENDYAAALKGFSFPSGHASHSLAIYGLLAYAAWVYLPQPWSAVIAALAGLLIFLVGLSRVYLGAHFPTDVLGAWLISGGVLFAIIKGLRL